MTDAQETLKKGSLLAEGKTKRIWGVFGTPRFVILESKDDITAGDGKKHDIIPEKGRLATQTTCNVFALLKDCGIPVAFERRISTTEFLAPRCNMIQLEVVARREGHGSYLQRNPHILKGAIFPRLIVEFYLKTAGRKWQGRESVYDLVCDDPLIIIESECTGNNILLFDPHKPIAGQEPFLKLPFKDVFPFENVDDAFMRMDEIVRQAFLVLEKAWQIQGRRLVDFKIEFGVPNQSWGTNLKLLPEAILIADVIDNDSWRVLEDGQYIDKQIYRDSKVGLSEVAAKYALVAELTDRFVIPSQSLVLWKDSEKDDAAQFSLLIAGICGRLPNINKSIRIRLLTQICSMHKEPVRAWLEFQGLIQDNPDSVVVAYVGKSNGAGPTLSAICTVPVITVPASAKDFPEDIWSSLRTPSNVSAMTVLDLSNAVLAALQILAMRNPYLYACLRIEQEKRFLNVFLL